MSDSESDIEMKSTLPKKSDKKTPSSPKEHLEEDPKKLSTKEMIYTALKELKTRKGVSLHAIKKYMVETYNANTDKLNFYIKKYIKQGVDSGEIIQTKGIGVSGSFKLAQTKKETKMKKATKKKIEKPDKPKSEKPEKKKKESSKNKPVKKGDKKEKKGEEKTKSLKEKPTLKKEKKIKVTKKVTMAENPKKEPKRNTEKSKMAAKSTPAKKKTIVLKRKSIGSIVKPPKMKPTRA